MNLQHVVQPKSTSNGFGRRKVERDMGTRQAGKANPSKVTNAGSTPGVKAGGHESPSRDRLVYLTTCFIGHSVEVQVKNGSVYSGIFHATNADKDFGVILKMARLIKDGTLRGQKAIAESVSKAPSKTLIIPAKELVQVVAKDVAVTRDGLSNGTQSEDIMLDSSISQSRQVDAERELAPWVPDEDDPQCPELENIFDGPWNSRSWDQFETNAALFGVKSTFDEELYTTKLERGPQMRELEREALRIAREIEGEETHDLHLAEERGIHHEGFDIDEETRFSSVYRGRITDDSGYEENDDIMANSHNNETFGSSSPSISKKSAGLKSSDGALVSSSSSLVDEAESLQSSNGANLHSSSNDDIRQLASEPPSKDFSSSSCDSRIQENPVGLLGGNNDSGEFVEMHTIADNSKLGNAVDEKVDGFDREGLFAASADATSCNLSKGGKKMISSGELSEGAGTSKAPSETQLVNPRGRPGSSTSSSSDCIGAASVGPGLSPSSSVGSLSSERSTLNPHAKEFKLNPNAKSFTPSQTGVRPQSPVSDGSFYYPSGVSAVPHMHSVPLGYGIAPSFAGPQPVIYNPQVAPVQTPQPYFHPNGPHYGQPMLLGQPRQVMYMPNYQPEMPYKGRDY